MLDSENVQDWSGASPEGYLANVEFTRLTTQIDEQRYGNPVWYTQTSDGV